MQWCDEVLDTSTLGVPVNVSQLTNCFDSTHLHGGHFMFDQNLFDTEAVARFVIPDFHLNPSVCSAAPCRSV
jgi:hypothetical protein